MGPNSIGNSEGTSGGNDVWQDFFTLEEIADGIYRFSQGEDLEKIKESIVGKDWNGDEETNLARGMHTYNRMLDFLGIERRNNG